MRVNGAGRSLVSALSVAVLLLGCSDWPSPVQPKVPDPIFELPVAPAKPVVEVEKKELDPDDLIQPGDALEVIVRRGGGEEKYQLTVRASGLITVAFTDIDVKGLDEQAAEARIAEAISPYVRSPRVQVRLLRGAERERWIYVTGEVRKGGGKIKIDKRATVLTAITAGEGFTDQADMSRIVVISPRAENKNLIRVANIENALRTGDMSADLRLRDGDIVFVPRSRMGDWSAYYSKVVAPILNALIIGSNVVFINKALADLFAGPQQAPGVAVGGGGTCWIARALYGDEAWQPHVLRWYIWGPFSDHWYGQLFADLYRTHGERIASFLNAHPWTKGLVKPLFDRLLDQAIKAADRRLPGFAAASGAAKPQPRSEGHAARGDEPDPAVSLAFLK